MFAFVLRHDVGVILFRGVIIYFETEPGVRIFRNRTTRGVKNWGVV